MLPEKARTMGKLRPIHLLLQQQFRPKRLPLLDSGTHTQQAI